MNNFFIPLIKSVKSVPTIIQPYSKDSKLYLSNPNKALLQNPIKINIYK